MVRSRITLSLLLACAALLCGCAVDPVAVADDACAAGAQRAPGDARIARAIQEARRQHQLFGGQTIERNGGLFRVGYYEADWARPRSEATPTWQRVAAFWAAVPEAPPPQARTSEGWVNPFEVSGPPAAGGPETPRTEVAVREALQRAAIVDTPWSAVFISYLMKTAGFSGNEFAFSDSHFDYVRASLAVSAAEAAGREAAHAFRACDVATTRPRAGDLLCATRGGTAHIDRFDTLAAALRERPADDYFPMHCDLVVRADAGGDGGVDVIGGNVIQSVTLARMALDGKKRLDASYFARGAASACAPDAEECPGHLARRPWVVLLQFRR